MSHSTREEDLEAGILPMPVRIHAPCVASVAEHTGWAHVVCVAARDGVPAVVERRKVTLIDAGLPTQPYEHDSRALREDEADALIARVRRSIANRTALALRRLVAAHASALRDSPHRLGDLCFTLQAGRLHQRQRLAIVASTRAELRSTLALLEPWEGRFGHRELAIFAGPAEEQPGAAGETAVVSPAPSDPSPESDRQRQLEELAARYARGETIDWSAVQEHEAPRRRVPLPWYPFEQRRYWHAPSPRAGHSRCPDTGTGAGAVYAPRTVKYDPPQFLTIYH